MNTGNNWDLMTIYGQFVQNIPLLGVPTAFLEIQTQVTWVVCQKMFGD